MIANAVSGGPSSSLSNLSYPSIITPVAPAQHPEDTHENSAKRLAALLNLVYERSTTKMLVLSFQRQPGYDSAVTHVDANIDHCAIQVTLESFVNDGLFDSFVSDYPTTRIDDSTEFCYQFPDQIPKTSFSYWIFPCAQISSLNVHV